MRLKSLLLSLCVPIFGMFAAADASAQTLRFGLAEDPDVLDPTLARTFVGRVVFAALCDKLFDIDDKLNIVPQLATGYEWSADSKALTIKLRAGVTFHDGEKFDAAAASSTSSGTRRWRDRIGAANSRRLRASMWSIR
jgi:peptide/nickel transport system substrate-binding protein